MGNGELVALVLRNEVNTKYNNVTLLGDTTWRYNQAALFIVNGTNGVLNKWYTFAGFVDAGGIIEATSLDVDEANNVAYVGGSFTKRILVRFAGNDKNLTAVGSFDIFVAKINLTSGACIWFNTYGGGSVDSLHSLKLNPSKTAIAFGGSFRKVITFDGYILLAKGTEV